MTFMFKHTTARMGGWYFVKVDTDKKTLVTGHSGATAESYSVDIPVKVATRRELNDVKDRFVSVFDFKDLGDN